MRIYNVTIEVPDFETRQLDAADDILRDVFQVDDPFYNDVDGSFNYGSTLGGLSVEEYAGRITREFRKIKGCSLRDEYKRVFVLFTHAFSDVEQDNDPRHMEIVKA